ncbi:Putative hydrolase RBBP9 [Seminavis robusta]|uniref:Hydrolase RBBP9 n=1 Tax=Seminavis robusta TaxID=568900 RepID=A0A9N8D9H5_9STRA|nr:Putative hydrolase RBBP9 [Seminavis robusta]|eukprot:Sro41_g025230.1 Putative hydrolase RBBP9 (204) ;mRNA; r:86626-87237
MKTSVPTTRAATVIICPGNGCTNVKRSNWYGEFHTQLQELKIPSVCENFPDPHRARRAKWIPFIRAKAEETEDPSNIILVGHSSGAQAALRYAEQYPLKAVVLVSATYTDLGDAGERASGYYPQTNADGGEVTNPYLFDQMKQNCPIWYQFHSDDDPFIPLHEAEQIRDGLGLTDTYKMLPGRSHFFEGFPELRELFVSSAFM